MKTRHAVLLGCIQYSFDYRVILKCYGKPTIVMILVYFDISLPPLPPFGHCFLLLVPSLISLPSERDIPEDLDQKLITWELLQKENYLANLEIKKKESNEEKLKKMSDK